MRIRKYTAADFDALRQMHAAQGFGYPLPDLDSPLFVVKLVLEEDEDSGTGFSLSHFSSADDDRGVRRDPVARTFRLASRGETDARLNAGATKSNQNDRELLDGREEADRDSLLEAGSMLSAGCPSHPWSCFAGLRVCPEGDSPRRASGSPFALAQGKRIVMAVLLRLTAETYLLHDPRAGTPRERWQNFLALHEAAQLSASALGLDDVQAFLPPRVARAFGRRLARLGWRQDPWPCFCRVIRES